MDFGFLFWLFFIGIVVASMQDLKRREVDNWLNLFLLIASFSFIFYKAIFEKDVGIVFQAGFALVIMFVMMNIFYYGRVFAGGDAKLLVALTVFFIGIDFNTTLVNIGMFLLFLMFSGSIYGLIYSFILYFKDFDHVNKEIKKYLVWEGRSKLGFFVLGAGIVLMFFGFLNFIFFLVGVLCFTFPILYVFAKGLENVVMVRDISWKDLREGDWLVEDIRVGKKTIKADWDGLSLDDIKRLKGRKIKIKEGLPFVPAFFIAFLTYVFLKDWLLKLVLGY